MGRKTDFIQKASIDVVQATVLTPLPGTRLFSQYEQEGRLSHNRFPKDWDRYDMGELTYVPKHMGEVEFSAQLRRVGRRCILVPSLAYKF